MPYGSKSWTGTRPESFHKHFGSYFLLQTDCHMVRITLNKKNIVIAPPSGILLEYSVRPVSSIGRVLAVFAQHLCIISWITVSFTISKLIRSKNSGQISWLEKTFTWQCFQGRCFPLLTWYNYRTASLLDLLRHSVWSIKTINCATAFL